jgi:hypothetical protein
MSIAKALALLILLLGALPKLRRECRVATGVIGLY